MVHIYDVALPTLALAHRPVLAPILEQVGLEALTSNPQLGSLCPSCDVIGAAVHEARLLTTREGFTAAAASGVLGFDTATPAAPPLHLDRPHLVVIGDAVTHTPWFFGRVVDPRSP